MKNDKLWQLLLFLALIVIVCGFFTRSLTSSGTLYEYAQENPDIAYTKKETEPETKSVEMNMEEMQDNKYSDAFEAIAGDITENSNEGSFCAYPQIGDMEAPTVITSTDRVILSDGFFYEPITPEIEARIRGVSYPEDDSDIAITLDELSYVNVLYNDFDGGVSRGELICNDSIAQDLVEIFEELYRCGYQFERISLIDEYGGDDTLSMEHNNTSCFNYRVVDGTDNLSKHAYGLAIDINPYYNPYVVFNKDGTGETYISPKGSEVYTDRSKDFPYKIDENDLCYKLFIERGFTWGGNWNSSKDYQHFQKNN